MCRIRRCPDLWCWLPACTSDFNDVPCGREARTSAPASVRGQRGESPLEARAQAFNRTKLRRRKARWEATGGERPVRRVTNSIRPDVTGEPAGEWRSLDSRERGFTELRAWEKGCGGGASGGWRWKGRKAMHVKQGDLFGGGESGRSQSPHSSDEAPVMGVE